MWKVLEFMLNGAEWQQVATRYYENGRLAERHYLRLTREHRERFFMLVRELVAA